MTPLRTNINSLFCSSFGRSSQWPYAWFYEKECQKLLRSTHLCTRCVTRGQNATKVVFGRAP